MIDSIANKLFIAFILLLIFGGIMIFCSRCGAEHVDGAIMCIKCGVSLRQPQSSKDNINFGIGCLTYICMMVPLLGWILGLILYLSWKDSSPNRANMVGIMTLVYITAAVIGWVLYIAVFAAILGGIGGMMGGFW